MGGWSALTSALSFAATAHLPFHHIAHAEQKASIKGADLLATTPHHHQNSTAFVVAGAGWVLSFADLLGLESENTLPSQQGWCCGPGRWARAQKGPAVAMAP